MEHRDDAPSGQPDDGARASAWQPIETAPRDGRELLCCCGDLIRVCRPKAFQQEVWEYFRDEVNAPGHTWSMEPTHWMPLPPAPVSRGEGGE